jgi:hypothetical protein
MTTRVHTERIRTRLHHLREAVAESARDEKHDMLWRGPEEIDRVESLSPGQRERILRRGLVRRRHGEP